MATDHAEQLEAELLDAIDRADDLKALDAVRVDALGKKGRVTALMKSLGAMSPDERKAMGPRLNRLKDTLNARLADKKAALEAAALAERLEAERVDVTLPMAERAQGRVHPVSQVMDELAEIFADLGFSVAEGPDVEDDFHNFTALNIPEHHPARQMHDTFYLPPDATGQTRVLRTHTSPVQIRTMIGAKPPFRIIAPGRTYRADWDATHTPMFHQVEGLLVDEATHMGHLKGCLEAFTKAFFEVDDLKMRFRPSYFPFTEPSAELDIGCAFEDGQVKVGQGDDWLEILGCGMVHPRVLDACGIDSTRYQGFAFGCGIDRLAMLKYGMTDLRPFFDSDLRWMRHYGFLPLDLPSIAGGMSQ
ncbi:phenylalanyl-tRNA synthetase alpha subunit [Rhodothalassium salexigens DSM 2132]|uniref:Phenylalanine--tRNA ligase alpha subunit n=1 Tax=Rhodothalassium salexigens DSM 2132 TaxID=1188247 RepID=A0A4R2PHQ7_RHOSA|nr:phenylalanine--tRNA ligase subunit alpha [Rhodothalassium salexigens]MBB4211931.1 phenylalanyl-tRNA synthetase alpha chain [Rhodothalassium salexigens DSM 2132]MBK1639261.1 phenylalanine--tRNA ligase subunit alpha [Rhodothalassium salexigens DSM 2132]TCP33485.1 phenylalanyl-tRNA synthetase alpha subunit [Rhodothalassium salexigens DSM 2132]